MKQALAAAALIGIVGTSFAAPVVPNGSFESYNIASGSSEFLDTLQGPYPFNGYWSANGTETLIVNAGSSVLPAGNGQQYATFTGASQSIYQVISGFDVGQTYQVSFWATGATGVWYVDEPNATGAIVADSTWKQYSFTFNATAYDQHLWFEGGSSAALSVDNITISAVPEPETYALLLAGLGVVGAVARRRKSA